MKNEQKLETKTHLHFDFIDRIKILFGAIPCVKTDIWIPTNVESYNVVSKISFVSKTTVALYKDKPDYGYMMTAQKTA